MNVYKLLHNRSAYRCFLGVQQYSSDTVKKPQCEVSKLGNVQVSAQRGFNLKIVTNQGRKRALV